MAGMELLYVSAQSVIGNDSDAVVCALHWNMINNGFRCIGIGEEPPASSDGVKRSEMLPQGWNSDPSAYCLLYWPNASTDAHVLKVIPLDISLLIHVMRCSDNLVADFSVNISDYTNGDLSSFDTAYKNLDGLQKLFLSEIIKKLNKKTGASTSSTSSKNETRHERREPQPEHSDPLRIGPPRRGGRPVPDWVDPENPLAVGRGDLDPLAGGRGGGMFMDPRGFPGIGRDPNTGIPGRLPPGAVPPGARFDPFGPPDPDAPDGGNPRGGFRAGPDPDHLPPPGFDDMFM